MLSFVKYVESHEIYIAITKLVLKLAGTIF